MKKRLLFVDDMPASLDSLKQVLQVQGGEWDSAFVSNAGTALALLKDQAFDIVFANLKMSRMDGIAFLAEVKKYHPDGVRVLMAEEIHPQDWARAGDTAHQFLKKPCGLQAIRKLVQRTGALKLILENKDLRKLVGRISNLPTAPAIYTSLSQAMADPDIPLGVVAGILEKDISLSAKLLQMVNASFFGFPRQISSIQAAVSMLGMLMIKNLALSLEVFRGFRKNAPGRGFSIDQLQQHSLSTARFAMSLLSDKQEAETAFTAGLLHDIGQLVIVTQLPEKFAQIQAVCQDQSCPDHVGEKAVLGASHAEIGAYLLGLWGLPYPVLEAAAFHHMDLKVDENQMDTLGAVWLANQIAWQVALPESQAISSSSHIIPQALSKSAFTPVSGTDKKLV